MFEQSFRAKTVNEATGNTELSSYIVNGHHHWNRPRATIQTLIIAIAANNISNTKHLQSFEKRIETQQVKSKGLRKGLKKSSSLLTSTVSCRKQSEEKCEEGI